MLRKIKLECIAWVEAFLRSFPGETGFRLRSLWYRNRFRKSNKVSIGSGCEFVAPGEMSFSGTVLISNLCYFNADGGTIEIDDMVAFNRGVHINAACGGRISIGKNCPIGPGVVMRTANHKFSDRNTNIQEQGHEPADIIIENNCWISANVIIVGGVRIGTGAIIGAGAVVTTDIPAYAVAVGIPAKVIKFRN